MVVLQKILSDIRLSLLESTYDIGNAIAPAMAFAIAIIL